MCDEVENKSAKGPDKLQTRTKINVFTPKKLKTKKICGPDEVIMEILYI
jgi:hypothetical protein